MQLQSSKQTGLQIVFCCCDFFQICYTDRIFMLKLDVPTHGKIPTAVQAAAKDALQPYIKILIHDASAEMKMSFIKHYKQI
jgi:hypothetical protein